MRTVKKGAASVIFDVFIQDSSQTDGRGLAGLSAASAGMACYYHRNTAASATAVSLTNGSIGIFSSGGFTQVDSANMPGFYQLCLPDAAFTSGADEISVVMRGATNMVPIPLGVSLRAADEIADIVWAETMTEVTSVPAITGTAINALAWLFSLSRNKRTQTATIETLFRDDGSTTVATATKSDSGTTFTREEYS